MRWMLIALLLLACGPDVDKEPAPESAAEDTDEETRPQQEEMDAYKRRLEEGLGHPIEPADPDEEQPIDSIGEGPPRPPEH
jgi:hypothetical protein